MDPDRSITKLDETDAGSGVEDTSIGYRVNEYTSTRVVSDL